MALSAKVCFRMLVCGCVDGSGVAVRCRGEARPSDVGSVHPALIRGGTPSIDRRLEGVVSLRLAEGRFAFHMLDNATAYGRQFRAGSNRYTSRSSAIAAFSRKRPKTLAHNESLARSCRLLIRPVGAS